MTVGCHRTWSGNLSDKVRANHPSVTILLGVPLQNSDRTRIISHHGESVTTLIPHNQKRFAGPNRPSFWRWNMPATSLSNPAISASSAFSYLSAVATLPK